MSIELILGLLSLLTSVIAGVIGFGGGMLLIAIMPIFVASGAIIPIHGATQLASNSSRMIFSLKDVKWNLLPRFLLGSLIGVGVFGVVLVSIPTTYLPFAIGLYMLLNLWSPDFSNFIKRYENYYLIGFLQTGLGLIVGAPGPIAMTVLTKELKSKDQIIATASMFMTITHLVKIPIFGIIGFSLLEHSSLLIYMISGSILGSYIGTKIRLAANNEKLIVVIKILLTVMAVRMIVASLM
ncbi:MAG: TSUP family transporter [Cellvibrionaceae bacterium]